MRYRVEIRSVPEEEEWLLDQFGIDKDHIFSQDELQDFIETGRYSKGEHVRLLEWIAKNIDYEVI